MGQGDTAVTRLLVIDDDHEIQSLLKGYLTRNGYAVVVAATPPEAIAAIERWRIDAIILDIMLGRASGFDVCRKLREMNQVPIIMLSALSTDSHRLRGLELGADDYIAKPFNPELLLARVRAVLRRVQRSSSLRHRASSRRYGFSKWVFDGARRELVSPDGVEIVLSRSELRLMRVLLASPQVPLDRDELAAALAGTAAEEETGADEPAEDHHSRAIDVQVSRLRHKIERDPKRPRLIKTVRGTGYVLASHVSVLD